MKKYVFEINSEEKIYLQIYNKISSDISNGLIKKNEHLPSKRNMAIDLGVSISSVLKAYELLSNEGYIYSVEKKGYYASDINMPANKTNKPIKINEDINDIEYDFSTNKVDYSIFPKNKFNQISKDIIYNTSKYLNKSSSKGLIDLRYAIKEYLFESKDINVNVEQIIISSSTNDLMKKLVNLLNIKSIALENPGYHFINDLDIKINYIDLDNYGINIDKLNKSDSELVIVTPYNQFPLGIKMPLNRKIELIQAFKNKYIVEDSFDSNFRNNNVIGVSLFSLSNNVIYLESFSRTMYPGLCVSFMVLPDELALKYNKLFKGFSSVSSLDQLILAEFIKRGDFYKHVNKTRNTYLKKKKMILDNLDKNLFDIEYKDNYSNVILKIKYDIDYKKLKEELKNNKIDVLLLSDFYNGIINYDYLIIGFSGIAINKIIDGLDELSKVVRKNIKK